MKLHGLISSLLFVATLPVTQHKAQAFDATLGLKATASLQATVGLDDQTKAFIASLPVEIREQTYQLLQQALPLLNQSVDSYLDKVNTILSQQIDHLECDAVGAGRTLGDDFKSAITHGALKTQPVEDILKDAQSTQSGFRSSDSPERYAHSYEDLSFRIATTACQVAIDPIAAVPVAKLQATTRTNWRIWYRLEGKCRSASDCMPTSIPC
jgi:hypothetical protein